jgi:hypothetical protein
MKTLSAETGSSQPPTSDPLAARRRTSRAIQLSLAHGAVLAFALATALSWLAFAFLTDRDLHVDELGLFNPVYMFLRHGTMTYPAHGYFDSMVVHPPVHYLEIASFMKMGLDIFYAEAIPVTALTLLGILLVCIGPFPTYVKIGLIFGLFTAPLVYSRTGLSAFGLRPDTHVAVAWFSGLVALESGRLSGWDGKRLFLGAFLVTYASGIHYFAAPALTGVLVYMVWAWRRLPRADALRKISILVAGGAAFGLPYLVLFLWPFWTEIRAITTQVQGTGGVAQALERHLRQYEFSIMLFTADLGRMPLIATALVQAMRLQVPIFLIGTLVLTALPSTRGLGLASLPLPLFILVAPYKHAGYFIPETMLYLSAVGIVLAAGIIAAARLIHPKSGPAIGTVAAALVVGIGMLRYSPAPAEMDVTLRPRVHQMTIARAAAREIVGPHALVGGRIGLWYITGAADWHDITRSGLQRTAVSSLDMLAYLDGFDALVEHPHMSDVSHNGQGATLSTWYLDGLLELKGFYFGRGARDNSYFVFERSAEEGVIGFGLDGHDLYRFDAGPDGDHVFVAAVCPLGTGVARLAAITPFWNYLLLPAGVIAEGWTVRVPQPAGGAPTSSPGVELSAAVLPLAADGGTGALPPGCVERDRVALVKSAVDADALVAKSAREDHVMRFLPTPERAPARPVSVAPS